MIEIGPVLYSTINTALLVVVFIFTLEMMKFLIVQEKFRIPFPWRRREDPDYAE